MIKEKDWVEWFEAIGALIRGHFVLADLEHTGWYFDKRIALADTGLVSRITLEFALKFQNEDIDAVVGPASGAITLAHETARWLTFLCQLSDKKVLALYADKTTSDGEDDFEFKGNFGKMVKGKRVLVVEDVLTSGGSVSKVVKLVEACGGTVVGVCAVWNRKKVTAKDIGAPKLYALVKKRLPSWPRVDCKLCEKGVPVYTLYGRGKDFLRQRAAERRNRKK